VEASRDGEHLDPVLAAHQLLDGFGELAVGLGEMLVSLVV
jgi:hypothetical protein